MEVWVLLYASGYTSEADTTLFFKEEDVRKEFIKQVKDAYSNDELSLEEVLGYIERGEVYDESIDVSVGEKFCTWDGPEVYESLSYYKQEVL